VISGRRHTVEQMHQMMRTVGAEPAQWLPLFLNRFERR
jgi:type IV secretion system protein VirB4